MSGTPMAPDAPAYPVDEYAIAGFGEIYRRRAMAQGSGSVTASASSTLTNVAGRTLYLSPDQRKDVRERYGLPPKASDAEYTEAAIKLAAKAAEDAEKEKNASAGSVDNAVPAGAPVPARPPPHRLQSTMRQPADEVMVAVGAPAVAGGKKVVYGEVAVPADEARAVEQQKQQQARQQTQDSQQTDSGAQDGAPLEGGAAASESAASERTAYGPKANTAVLGGRPAGSKHRATKLGAATIAVSSRGVGVLPASSSTATSSKEGESVAGEIDDGESVVGDVDDSNEGVSSAGSKATGGEGRSGPGAFSWIRKWRRAKL